MYLCANCGERIQPHVTTVWTSVDPDRRASHDNECSGGERNVTKTSRFQRAHQPFTVGQPVAIVDPDDPNHPLTGFRITDVTGDLVTCEKRIEGDSRVYQVIVNLAVESARGCIKPVLAR